MGFELSDIRRLLDAFEQSDWDEVHLVADGVEVHIASGVVTPTIRPGVTEVPTSPPAPVPVPPAAVVEPPPVSPTVPAAVVEDAHAVVAPSPGIFWRSPAPGEPPFVEVGQRVSPETPVGIVEVMKLMNQVLAGVDGTVQVIVVENGASVERGEPMVLIQPDA
jgi:acetyl-CoA carboxylase biotin carboxyl carrier protein